MAKNIDNVPEIQFSVNEMQCRTSIYYVGSFYIYIISLLDINDTVAGLYYLLIFVQCPSMHTLYK